MGSEVIGRSSALSFKYCAMEFAFAARLPSVSRTSFGLPVEPDVASSSASSGCIPTWRGASFSSRQASPDLLCRYPANFTPGSALKIQSGAYVPRSSRNSSALREASKTIRALPPFNAAKYAVKHSYRFWARSSPSDLRPISGSTARNRATSRLRPT